ncbi:MAG: PepSY domain-containing protein [Alistipes sp.]|nr:PepSY domain-containing protein [Alistipes sp.]
MKKLFRKLHLWLSVPFGVFITLICFSGAMLVFEREITEACRRDLCFVEKVGEKPLPLDSLMTAVAATLPDSVSVTGLTISPDPTRSWQVGLSKPRRASLYVDPYTGEVKGRYERLPFYDTMFHLHRWMLGASTGSGKLLVGISTLMLVVILITGLLMWLTNRNKPLVKSLKISFSKGWMRFWHDLHVAGGIYATIFLLALALTGLTWSFSWYRTGFYKAFGVETSAGGGHGEPRSTANAQQEQRGNRDGARSERPERSERSDAAGNDRSHRRGEERRVHEGEGRPGQEAVRPHSPYAHWQEIYEGLAQSHPGYRQITLSDGSASVVPAGRTSLRSGDRFEFDRRGRITNVKPYAEQEKSAKVRSGVYTVHVGSWGGLATRILTFLAALLGATLPLTGYYLWIRRLVKKGHPHHEK